MFGVGKIVGTTYMSSNRGETVLTLIKILWYQDLRVQHIEILFLFFIFIFIFIFLSKYLIFLSDSRSFIKYFSIMVILSLTFKCLLLLMLSFIQFLGNFVMIKSKLLIRAN